MKFLYPQWLWVIAVLPVLYFLIAWDERKRLKRLAAFADSTLWGVIVPEIRPGARKRKALLWLLGILFLVLALARPQLGSHEEVSRVSGLDILVVLDISNSMETEDVIPNRLKKSKHLLKTLVERLKGDRLGLVAFAGSSYVACPLTTDLEYFLETVQLANPKMIQNQGTHIGWGLETARKALERGAEEPTRGTDVASNNASSQAIILISDGEDHGGEGVENASAIAKAGIKLYVLGVGTQKGAPIPIRDASGNLQGYKKDRTGQAVVSAFNPDSLIKVAGAAGGRYWNISVDETEIAEILQDMGALDRTDYAERRYLVYEERFQFPLAMAILMFLLELGISLRKPQEGASKLKLPFSKRRMAVASGILVLFPSVSYGVPLGSYLDNRKGIDAYKEGNIEEAKKNFGSAQARDPNSPELKFNQGLVQMNQDEVDNAIIGFGEAAKDAVSKKDPSLAGKSFFNLGGALTKKGDTRAAIQSYINSIQSAREAKDSQLEADARKNLQLLVQQMQEKQQQQKQQSDESQKSESQPQDSKGDQDSRQKQRDEQNQKQANGKDQKRFRSDPKQDGKKQFKSLKLTDEDAEKVMAQLKERERELQMRLKRQNGKPQGTDKDW